MFNQHVGGDQLDHATPGFFAGQEGFITPALENAIIQGRATAAFEPGHKREEETYHD
jgi:hypothetical protein